MKAIQKIKEVGLPNVVTGFIKRIQYVKLMKKYHFDVWHLSPYEWRQYMQECAKYINADSGRAAGQKNGSKTVVDIGCGLGGLLQHIKADKRIGLDIHKEVILAARELSKGGIVYQEGSFEDVAEDSVDYFVTLNFMHGGTEDTWIEPYRKAAERNHVLHFMVDTVPSQGGSHFLDWRKILPENYKRIERLGPFSGGRYLEVWERQ